MSNALSPGLGDAITWPSWYLHQYAGISTRLPRSGSLRSV